MRPSKDVVREQRTSCRVSRNVQEQQAQPEAPVRGEQGGRLPTLECLSAQLRFVVPLQ